MAKAPSCLGKKDISVDKVDAVLIKKQSPIFKGNWRLLPPEVVKKKS